MTIPHMTRKETITSLLAQADDLRQGGRLPEACALEDAADWLRNDYKTDREAVAEKFFRFGVCFTVISSIGLALSIVSAFFGWGGCAPTFWLSVAACALGIGLMLAAAKVVK